MTRFSFGCFDDEMTVKKQPLECQSLGVMHCEDLGKIDFIYLTETLQSDLVEGISSTMSSLPVKFVRQDPEKIFVHRDIYVANEDMILHQKETIYQLRAEMAEKDIEMERVRKILRDNYESSLLS